MTATPLEVLRSIEAADPDGGLLEPTDADHDRHQAWAVRTYGEAAWEAYRAGGWEPEPQW